MRHFYRTRYRRFYEATDQLDERYIQHRRWPELARLRIARYAHLLRRGIRIVDVGCGAGLFLHEARERFGAHVLGIEPDPVLRRYARDVLGLDVIDREVAEITETYDVITGFHVLEHLHDVAGFFSAAQRSLGSDGRLVVETPNLECERLEIGFFHVAHLFAFTLTSLEQLAGCHGFAVERNGTNECALDRGNLHAVMRPAAASRPIRSCPPRPATLSRLRSMRSVRTMRLARWAVKQLLVRSRQR
jgi:SAM-dependent methyltransferase